MKKLWLWLPLLAFAIIVAVAIRGLSTPSDPAVKSALVGKPLPEFALAPVIPGKPGVSTADFRRGEPRLLNVFASWCVPCIAEAPQLARLEAAGAKIDAVAIRDTEAGLRQFLTRYGDPFERIGDDPRSAVQFALGSSGVPETFVVDGRGVIRMQHIGNITDSDVPKILAALEAAK